MKRIRAAALVIMATLVPAFGHAQEPAPKAAPPTAPSDERMTFHGAFDVGVRATDVNGSTDMYRRMFNLNEGLRLMSVDLFGAAPRSANLFADTLAFSLNGVGDPFSGAQFTMRKVQRYDLRVTWRRSRFIDTWPLTPTSIGGLNTQVVTDFHAWATSRYTTNVGFVYDASTHLHLLFNYSRVSRSGAQTSTQSIDFVGAPSTWGGFARANPYATTAPVDDASNRATGGVSYSAKNWTLTYQAGYQRFNQEQVFSPVATPERSINITDPATASELVTTLNSSQTRRLETPISELSYVARPSSKIEWRGEYLFARYHGPFSQAATYKGTARTTSSTVFSPYDVTLIGNGTAAAPSHVIGQALTYRIAKQWTAFADYRYSRFSMEADGTLRSTLALYPTGSSAPVVTTEEDEESWRQTSQTASVAVAFEPSSAFTIRPGVRVVHRDIERRIEGAVDAGTTQKNTTVWPELTVAYRPTTRFNARASYRRADSDRSYTRLSPVDRSIGNLFVRYEPIEGLTIEASANVNDAELPAASFLSHTRFGSLQASHKVGERATLFGGFDYQSFLAKGSVSFLRGAAPILDDEMIDREKDRIWLVGALVKVTDRFGVTATANFLRTVGTDSIAGEPPLYGPMTFPYGTGSIYYDIPRAGRLSLDVSRAHWEQEILSLNDFRATLVTVRFSREF